MRVPVHIHVHACGLMNVLSHAYTHACTFDGVRYANLCSKMSDMPIAHLGEEVGRCEWRGMCVCGRMVFGFGYGFEFQYYACIRMQ